MWNIGINANAYTGLPFADSVKLIKENGFFGVFTGTPKERETAFQWAELLADAGLAYETMHAPFSSINSIWLEGEEGDAMLGSMLDCVDMCAAVNVPIAVIHLSSGNTPPPITDLGRARFDRLIGHAGEAGVKLAFENQRMLANIAYIFETYAQTPHVGFCWDCGHENCFTPGRRYMPLFGSHLICTHLHDNLGRVYGKHDDLHLLPFDGSINYETVAAAIAASSFRGTLMLEVSSSKAGKYPDLSPEQFFARAADAARRLAGLCDAAMAAAGTD